MKGLLLHHTVVNLYNRKHCPKALKKRNRACLCRFITEIDATSLDVAEPASSEILKAASVDFAEAADEQARASMGFLEERPPPPLF